METRLHIEIVGYYRFSTADPEDCRICHDADYGDILVEGICGKCLCEFWFANKSKEKIGR